MKLYRLYYRQSLPVDLQTCWEFFSNPANLRDITPASLDFRITSERPELMYAGMIISYRIRPVWGLDATWITEITHVREPFFFVDEQRFGPYRFWHHQHHFRPIEGGVEMVDEVHYALPLGILGQLMNHLMVEGKLKDIFTYRRRVLEQRFGVFPPPS